MADPAHEVMDAEADARERDASGDDNDPDAVGDVNGDPDAVGDINNPDAVGDDTYDPDAAVGDIDDPDAAGDNPNDVADVSHDPDAVGDISDPDAGGDPDAVGDIDDPDDDTGVGIYVREALAQARSSSSQDGYAEDDHNDPGSASDGSETVVFNQPVVDNVNKTKRIAGITVVTLDRSVTEVEVREALISRVRDRGSIRSLHESDDEMYFRMATPEQANRVIAKMDGVTMNALGVMIKLH